ncbi:putative phage replication protein, partial [Acinetobacter baumannii]|nr:putative phage replication protein [Acinetobacter baumannii]HAV4310548.1 putative phage replication protein [Acinetobacter baumannii]
MTKFEILSCGLLISCVTAVL